MAQNWLDREFEKAKKTVSTFPKWMQEAIRIESDKSLKAVADSQPSRVTHIVSTETEPRGTEPVGPADSVDHEQRES